MKTKLGKDMKKRQKKYGTTLVEQRRKAYV